MNKFELKEKLEELASKSYELVKEVEELDTLVLQNEIDFENDIVGNLISNQFSKSLKKLGKAYIELDALAKIA